MSLGHEEDLAFMRWVREASTSELAAQRPWACDWQRLAIERELGRRQAGSREALVPPEGWVS